MHHQKTSRFYFISLMLMLSHTALGQQNSLHELATNALQGKKTSIFRGLAVSGDLAGLGMKVLNADYSWAEVAGRINLKDTYYPIAELGYGFANAIGDETDIQFRTTAPYFRAGLDYNFFKDKSSGNKIFGGVRYGFSSFTYDVTNPHFSDPVWGSTERFHLEGVKGNAHWSEFVFGIETKIWSIVHLGWSVRYKYRLSQTTGISGQPTYIPGYGKNDSSSWGGTLYVAFDISHLLNSTKK